jgi:ribosomal-protein-alanine N-acetyltransferase
MKYLGGVMSPVEVEERLKLEMERARLINVQYWPIFERSTGYFAGCAGLRPYHHEEKVFEVGVHIMRRFWSEGLGEEAARAVIRFAFDEMKAKGLSAGHNPENIHSKDLLRRLGFAFSHIEPWGPLQSGHLFYRLQPGDLKPRLDDLSVA